MLTNNILYVNVKLTDITSYSRDNGPILKSHWVYVQRLPVTYRKLIDVTRWLSPLANQLHINTQGPQILKVKKKSLERGISRLHHI